MVTRPVIGVGAVVFDADGRVVLIKRGKAPLEGRWTLPGGSLEVGETLAAATAREVLEETGLIVDVGPLIEVFEHQSHQDDGALAFHYVILDYLCRPTGGALCAGSDARDAAFVPEDDFGRFDLTDATVRVIAMARRVRSEHDWQGARLTPREGSVRS